MGKFSETTRKYFDTKDATVHIGTASGSFSFETEGHGVLRAELKVNAVSGTLTVTSKDGQAAGSCAHTLSNSFSAASAAGTQRKVNACDEWIDYAWVLEAPAGTVGEVTAGESNTSTSVVTTSGTLTASGDHVYSVAVSVAGDLSAESAKVVVTIDGVAGSDTLVAKDGGSVAIGDSGLSFVFASGTLVQNDTWTVNVTGGVGVVDADLLISAV